MLKGLLDDLRERMCCPSCRKSLVWLVDEVRCENCGQTFPIFEGVPILVSRENSVFDASSIVKASGTLTKKRGLRRLVPSISLNASASRCYSHLRQLLVVLGPTSCVLVVGGGEGGVSSKALEDESIEIIVSDIAIAPTTHICLDAHAIPFIDGSFDAIVAQAVLEHVVDPAQCVREFHRVLRPGGLVYAETPFMQQVHMGAYDFTRFTLLGHRRLFRQFEEVESGVSVGAGSALAWSLVYFLTSFSWNTASRRILNVGARFAFFWFKYFDLVIRSRVAANDAAAGVYFLGRRAESMLSDRELLKEYKGAI